ncbi:tripartite tricarboxylate transporter substrate binding protein [soil metagenome]
MSLPTCDTLSDRHLDRRDVLAAALGLLAATAAGPARAQAYPARAMQLIVPFAAGGGVDVVSRVVAEAAGNILKQRFVIENRGGAAPMLGSQAVAKADGDGYTLLAAPTTMVINPALKSNVSFDWEKDFVPVAMVAKLPFVVVAGKGYPASTMKELEQVGRTAKEPITFGSGGAGTVAHLAGEFFGMVSGAKVQHVAYRVEAPALTDTISGNISVMFCTLASASGQIKGGTLKALGVTTAKRTALLPDVPTVAEQGYAGYDLSAWVAIVAPKGTPPAVVNVLNGAINAALALPEVNARLIEIGAEPAPGTAAELGAFMAKDAKVWAEVVKTAAIKVE